MVKTLDRTINFIKNETLLSVSLVLAIISSLIIKPNKNYLNYINWETIILLLVIMLIVEILKNLTIFEIIIRKLLIKIRNTRKLITLLVLTTLVSSIFITNDVSLIIFVPFSIMTLKKVKKTDLIIITVSLQTLAANIGCMILPIGSPHNIVLYTNYNITFTEFFLILLPYIIISIIFLLTILYFIPKEDITKIKVDKIQINKKNFIKRVLTGVDYYLLLTFIALFILIGNLEHIPTINLLFEKLIIGNELLSGILISQIISNVPTAVLLSSYSNNYQAIIIGINLGGFGTLIASMANLISYKILIKYYGKNKLRYLIIFTLLNVILLVLLWGFNMLITI